MFSKYIFMFILEPNQLPHLWWCEEKPLLDRNVSTYIVNRTRTAVGYKTVRRTCKSSNWYCLHWRYVLHVRNYVLKKVLLLVMWFTQKYICSIRSKVENHKPVKKLCTLLIQFILLIKCFKYLDPSRQYLNCEPCGILTVPTNLRIYTPKKVIKVKSNLESAYKTY